MDLAKLKPRVGNAFNRMVGRDRGFPHMQGVPKEDAVAISKTHMTSQGLGQRGGTYTYQDRNAWGIIMHGEYGYFIIGNSPSNEMFVDTSRQYNFTNVSSLPGVSEHAVKLTALLVRSMCCGMDLTALTQWFDSVYRLTTNRRTSPNFHPKQTYEKLLVMIEPGIDLLESRYPHIVQPPGLHTWF